MAASFYLHNSTLRNDKYDSIPTDFASNFFDKLPKIPGTQYKIIHSPFFPWTFRSGHFLPELIFQQHFRDINKQMIPNR